MASCLDETNAENLRHGTDGKSNLSTTLWIFLGIAVVFGLGYVFAMRNLARKSREADKRIDYSKIRKWKDEDSEEDQ